MSERCQIIVFSNKAYNAIIRESFDKDPVETGGILLGHILNNGMWIVMEVLPPGINSIFEYAYFEYDDEFVNYLAQSVANQYKVPLELLGLWHRHPGSMDFFSTTDDQTNSTFAALNSFGVISGLVNLDPKFRLTMYHLSHSVTTVPGTRPRYEKIPIEVGDDIIPEEYFELRYFDSRKTNLHPTVDRSTRTAKDPQVSSSTGHSLDWGDGEDCPSNRNILSPENKLEEFVFSLILFFRHHRLLFILTLFFIFGLSLRYSWSYLKMMPESVIELVKRKNKKSKSLKTINIKIGEKIPLIDYCPPSIESMHSQWRSTNNRVEIKKDTAIGKTSGLDTLWLSIEGKSQTSLIINVEAGNIQINKTKLCLQVGKTDTLMVIPLQSQLKWNSSDDNIVTVDENGIISAVSKGHCIISCHTHSGETVNCSVIVINAEEKVEDELIVSAGSDSSHLITAYI